MNVMRSFTLKSLKHNKKRTIVTILGVVISAAMITAVTTFVASLVAMVQQSTIADGGNWHAVVSEVPVQNADTITGSDAVQSASLARDEGYAAFDSEDPLKPYLIVRDYDQNGFTQMSVRLVSGRLPAKPGEVLVSKNAIKSDGAGFSAGDTLKLTLGRRVGLDGKAVDRPNLLYGIGENGQRVISEQIVPERTMTCTVVGIMDPPSFEKSWSAGYGVAGYLDPSALSSGRNVDVYLTAASLDRSIYQSIPALAKQAGSAPKNVSYNNELLRYYGIVSQDNVYGFMQVFVLVIVLIIMIASVSLIYNAFAISVSERSRQLGLLSSAGATRRQKRASVYFEGFFIGLIGIPLGILAGIGGMAVTLAAIRPLLDSFLQVSPGVSLTLIVPWFAVVMTAALSAVTIFVSVYVPARRASKITPIDAIRLSKEVRLTRRSVRTSRLTRRLFGFEAEIALKNLKRSRTKYRATIVSLVISLLLFLTVSTYAQMTTSLSGATYAGYNYDIGVVYSGASDAQRTEADAAIVSLGPVTGHVVTAQLFGTLTLAPDRLTSYSKQYGEPNENGRYELQANVLRLDSESFDAFAKAAGADPAEYADAANPQTLLINYAQDYAPLDGSGPSKLSGGILNVRPGDTLTIHEQEGAPATAFALTVGAVTDLRPMGTLIQNFTAPTFVVAEPVFNGLTAGWSAKDRIQSIQYATYLNTNDDQRLEKQIAEVTQGIAGASIQNIKSATRTEQNLMLFIGIFVYGFIILISLICIANIFNTVSTNIALRRREFAMLRSVGMSPRGFSRMIRFESIFYGLKGLLYGLPLSVAAAFLLYRLEQPVLQTPFTLPWQSYAFAVGMIFVIVFTTMLYASAKIKKENILDALKEENA